MEENKKTMTVSFCDGAGSVTGANFLCEIESGKFLVDCGMTQGDKNSFDKNSADFPYNPADIDVLLITHSHQDHIGRIPKLVRDGFRGIIYSTVATRDLSNVMLRDALGIMEMEAHDMNRDPIFQEHDIDEAMKLWKVVPYHNRTEFLPGATFEMFDAGHVLGSSIFRIEYGNKAMAFTGDLGNSPSELLRDIENFPPVNYMLMESVYGDRVHEERQERTEKLQKVIQDSHARGGILMIPAFSLERTQELLFTLNDFVEHNRIPKMAIYLDSPLAIEVTEVYQAHDEEWKKSVRDIIHGGDDIFDFPGLRVTREAEDSKKINQQKPPFIVVAGSGMMHGGRIMHHAKHYMPDPNNTLLFIGYQAPGTVGRLVQSGVTPVLIHNKKVPVRCRIETIQGYSGHADRDQLVDFVQNNSEKLEQVFCVMGEPKSSQFLAQRISDYVGVKTSAPSEGESVVLDF
ncbi:MAG: MBL fold metallo-hydrolase [Candidatus Nomurabacteria bacterium]|nr:MBL fold metallo-hydrolase [Candidatus Nomurabacteria bacterium]